MKTLLVVVVVLSMFFTLFIFAGTHTAALRDTPFYWVAKDMGTLFNDIGGSIKETVLSAVYPVTVKMHFLKK